MCQFKANFIQVFETGQHDDGLEWAFHMTDTLAIRFGITDHYDGQAFSAQLADDAISSLPSE